MNLLGLPPASPRRPLLLVLLLTLLASGWTASAAPLDEEDDLVREFKVYYDKDKSEAERYEAVRVLEGIDSLGAARALLLALEDEAFPVRRMAITTLASHTLPATAAWLVENVLEDRKAAKNTVLLGGVIEALGGIGDTVAYAPLMDLVDHKDMGVRLGAVAGLGLLGDARAAPRLSKLAVGPEAPLAVGALDALVAIGLADRASDAVVAAMAHAEFRVRARAIAAVWDLKLKVGIGGLIERMALEQGRLRGDAYDTLKRMTRLDFSDKADVWETWWGRNETRWKLPDFEAIAAAEERERIHGTAYSAGGKAFLGVETKSESIIFVIDVSDSMNTPFGDPERLKQMGREYDSLQRLAIVKEELIHTIESLPDSTSFNIMAFATGIESWKKKLTRANILNKNNASTWVRKLKPKGGSGASFRRRTGLADLRANDGQTNTHLALLTALGEDVNPKRKRKKGADGFVLDDKTGVDTIFFLTDGEPTVGETVDMNVIRSEVSRVNQYKGVQIHVIYVGNVGGDDFRVLAEENGGIFVSIGG